MTTHFAHLVHRLRLRHFELLALLRTEGTVRGAARRMSLTQPAVSKLLREIEACFGAELFERSRTGVRANAAGEAVVGQSLAIVNELRALHAQVDRLSGGATAFLRVGTFSVIPRVPVAIARLRRQSPSLVVQVLEGTGVELLRALREGELDCVVGALPPELLQLDDVETLRLEPIADDHLCVMCSPKHVLADRRRLQWTDLADEQWALPPKSSLLRRAVIEGHLLAGLAPPSPVVEMLSPVSLAGLVGLDAGLLSVMRLEHALFERNARRLRILPVRPQIALPPLAFITRGALQPAGEALLAFNRAVREG